MISPCKRGHAAASSMWVWATLVGVACGGSSSLATDAGDASQDRAGDAQDTSSPDHATETSDAEVMDAEMEMSGTMPDGPAVPPACGEALFGESDNPFQDPVESCHWTPAAGDSPQVGQTPVVIDIDRDGKSEIIFLTPPKSGLGSIMHAIRGTDCSEVWSRPVGLYINADLAVGDVTGDTIPDIVGYDYYFQIMRVFDLNGKVIAEGDRVGAYVGQGAPAIADLDGEPPAEIVMSDAIFRLELGTEWLKTLWVRNTYDLPTRFFTVIGDVDMNGEPDLVVGNHIFSSGLGEDLTPPNLKGAPPGMPAVAQIDPSTPEPEIVLVSHQYGTDGQLMVVNAVTGAVVFGPYVVPSKIVGGLELALDAPPVVADVDGDGKLEIGVAGPGDYRVYDLDCAGDPAPEGCAAPGLKWASTVQGSFASTAFDFNDDCATELVFVDRCDLRIFDGQTGATLGQASVGAPPNLSEPVIADVDGDGHAEIVVASKGGYACDGKVAPGGLTVFRDADGRWAYARRIWNQHTFHVTNVEEDGSIPPVESWFWEKNLGFRTNTGRAP